MRYMKRWKVVTKTAQMEFSDLLRSWNTSLRDGNSEQKKTCEPAMIVIDVVR